MSRLQMEFTMLKGLFSSENGVSRCQLVTIATEFFLNSGSIEGALNMLKGNHIHSDQYCVLAVKTGISVIFSHCLIMHLYTWPKYATDCWWLNVSGPSAIYCCHLVFTIFCHASLSIGITVVICAALRGCKGYMAKSICQVEQFSNISNQWGTRN